MYRAISLYIRLWKKKSYYKRTWHLWAFLHIADPPLPSPCFVYNVRVCVNRKIKKIEKMNKSNTWIIWRLEKYATPWIELIRPRFKTEYFFFVLVISNGPSSRGSGSHPLYYSSDIFFFLAPFLCVYIHEYINRNEHFFVGYCSEGERILERWKNKKQIHKKRYKYIVGKK